MIALFVFFFGAANVQSKDVDLMYGTDNDTGKIVALSFIIFENYTMDNPDRVLNVVEQKGNLLAKVISQKLGYDPNDKMNPNSRCIPSMLVKAEVETVPNLHVNLFFS